MDDSDKVISDRSLEVDEEVEKAHRRDANDPDRDNTDALPSYLESSLTPEEARAANDKRDGEPNLPPAGADESLR